MRMKRHNASHWTWGSYFFTCVAEGMRMWNAVPAAGRRSVHLIGTGGLLDPFGTPPTHKDNNNRKTKNRKTSGHRRSHDSDGALQRRYRDP